MKKEKFDWKHDISWLNVWFGLGVIGNIVILGDLVGVFDLGFRESFEFYSILGD